MLIWLPRHQSNLVLHAKCQGHKLGQGLLKVKVFAWSNWEVGLKGILLVGIFDSNHCSLLSGISAQPFLEPLILLILSMFGFPGIATYHLPLDGYSTMIGWELVKPRH